ncbi:MAG: hypothetical protein ACI845_001458 [Gammaproteobacteria bacterium]|jgi:hypothetical protein
MKAQLFSRRAALRGLGGGTIGLMTYGTQSIA